MRTGPDLKALRVARIFDGERLLDGPGLVLLGDDRIAGVPQREGELPADVAVEDLGDVTLLPGLIDAHVHLAFDATEEAVVHVQEVHDDTLLAQMLERAGRMLAAGITTVRDLGDRRYGSFAVRSSTQERLEAGPTVLAAGPPITVPGGHCWFLGGETAGGSIVAAVRERAERGVDVVKVMTTGGRLTTTTNTGDSQYDVDELRAAADAAHGLGLRIAGHAHGAGGIRDAVRAGFDTVEHVSFLVGDEIRLDPQVVAELAASRSLASLTLGQLPGAPLPPPLIPLLPVLRANLRVMREAGMSFVLGSDAGIALSKPHDVLPYAVTDWTDAGLPVDEALRHVTADAADALGRGDRIGRVAAGYDADLLAVRGDPLHDPAELRDVAAVYRHGVRVR